MDAYAADVSAESDAEYQCELFFSHSYDQDTCNAYPGRQVNCPHEDDIADPILTEFSNTTSISMTHESAYSPQICDVTKIMLYLPL